MFHKLWLFLLITAVAVITMQIILRSLVSRASRTCHSSANKARQAVWGQGLSCFDRCCVSNARHIVGALKWRIWDQLLLPMGKRFPCSVFWAATCTSTCSNSVIKQVFIEGLLCARYWGGDITEQDRLWPCEPYILMVGDRWYTAP